MNYTCQCCGYKTLPEPKGSYGICPICFWEDDIIQNQSPFYCGGANKISLYQAQCNFTLFRVSSLDYQGDVRAITETDEFDKLWKPVSVHEQKMDLVIIDLLEITTTTELHIILKNSLNVPDFYGMNWDAFWDAITGLVEMPKKIIFLGWYEFEKNHLKDAKKLRHCFEELQKEYPIICPEVEYSQDNTI